MARRINARKVKEKIPDEMDVVARNWGSFPLRVRRRIVQIARAYDPVEEVECFPTPTGAAWHEVEIVFLAPEWVWVQVRDVKCTFTFSRMWLADKRKPGVARSEWRMLRTYAENPDPDAYYRLPQRPNLKMDISKFRRWLKKFFGIPGDPLLPFKPMRWMPRFKVRIDEKKGDYLR